MSLPLLSGAGAALFLLLLSGIPSSSSSGYPNGFPPATGPNPWLPFQNLSGCHYGEHYPGLANLKDYLHHFGYLSNNSFSDEFDGDMEDAVKAYQHNFGLPPTGELDTSTIDQMMAPRCGVADVVINGSANHSSVHGRGLYAYFPGRPAWSGKKELKYALTATMAINADASTLRAVFARAFARWATVIPLTFTETQSPADADITIGFYYGAHGDSEPFDGPMGTLAHAFSPEDGRFHLDAAETWVVSGDVAKADSDIAVDLESVVLHEIGHLLGLQHTMVPEAIMYPTMKTKTKKVQLTTDDIDGIQTLYGSNPEYRGTSSSGQQDTGADNKIDTSGVSAAGGGRGGGGGGRGSRGGGRGGDSGGDVRMRWAAGQGGLVGVVTVGLAYLSIAV